jgi:hypothetical protein
MVMSCREQAERIEETVLQPVEQWLEQQEQRCRNEPCKWWMLCLNTLFCWLEVVVVKVTVWVTAVIVRTVYQTVCTVVMLVVGVVALLFGRIGIILQALKDLWTQIKEAFYSIIGAVIFAALRIVDHVQASFGLQPAKRRLTERERALLGPIFRQSLPYDVIELVVGKAGVLTTSGRAFTMGFTIYLPSYMEHTLVHECVHVWQFQSSGFRYIGNSALNQLDSIIFSPNYDPYNWRTRMDAGESWYTLGSAEAQAAFIEDVYVRGIFHFASLEQPDDTMPGAFFREDERGMNQFRTSDGADYTSQANAAWRILRTG